jgi:hypothetical protein
MPLVIVHTEHGAHLADSAAELAVLNTLFSFAMGVPCFWHWTGLRMELEASIRAFENWQGGLAE